MLVILAVVAVFGAASAAPENKSCANPVVANPGAWGEHSGAGFSLHDLELSDVPLPFPTGASACKKFAGHDTCCPKKTFERIEHFGDIADKAIDAASKGMGTAFDEMTKNFAKMADHCGMSPFCNDDVKKVIEEYSDKVEDALQGLAKHEATCSKALVAYSQGMICFACTADFQKYINSTANVVKLAEATCDDIYDNCGPVIRASAHLASTFVHFITDLLKAMDHGSKYPFPSHMFHMKGICNGTEDCKKFFCHHRLNGFGIPSLDFGGIDMKALLAAREQATPSFEDGIASLAAHHADTAALVLQKLGYMQAENGDSKSHNQFTSDGYDAYGVGCEDRGCPSNDGHPESGFPYWVLGVVGGVALVGAVAAAMFIHRRRALNAGETHPLIP